VNQDNDNFLVIRRILNELHSLSNLMKRAVAMGFVAANPVRRMSEKPSLPTDEADFLTTEDAAHLSDTVAEIDEYSNVRYRCRYSPFGAGAVARSDTVPCRTRLAD
jgi:hypothetical protein